MFLVWFFEFSVVFDWCCRFEVSKIFRWQYRVNLHAGIVSCLQGELNVVMNHDGKFTRTLKEIELYNSRNRVDFKHSGYVKMFEVFLFVFESQSNDIKELEVRLQATVRLTISRWIFYWTSLFYSLLFQLSLQLPLNAITRTLPREQVSQWWKTFVN